jgi:plasmid stability protein
MSILRLDDQLFQQTTVIAAAQGKTVDEFVSETLRQAVGKAVAHPGDVQLSTRNGLPVMLAGGAVSAIDPQKVRVLIEEEGF